MPLDKQKSAPSDLEYYALIPAKQITEKGYSEINTAEMRAVNHKYKKKILRKRSAVHRNWWYTRKRSSAQLC